jgi:phasin
MILLGLGDDAVSESEVKVELNGTNGMPLLGFSNTAFGEFAGQGLARAQEGCEKLRAVSVELAEALRETYSSNAKSATDYGLKVLDISKDNTASAIEFLAHLLASKTVTDVLTLSATHARKTFDTTSAQNKELWGLAQKAAQETSEPIRKHVAKAFNLAS